MRTWKPHPKQEEALRRIEFEVLYGGARGGGKTDTGLVWLTDYIDNPRFRGLVIRKNADDLSDWVDRASHFYSGFGASIAYRPAIITFPSGATIRTGHLKDDQAYTKYQGHEYHRMLIEELTQIPDEKRYLQLISSCRSTIPELKPQIFATTNPGGIGHAWVKKRFVDPAMPGTAFRDPTSGRGRIYIPATIDDNPTLVNNDPGYVGMLDSLKDTNTELWKAWRLGSWDVVSGQFFYEWRNDIHVVRAFTPPKEWKFYGGLDLGWNKQTAACWFAVTPEDRIYMINELYLNAVDFQGKYGTSMTATKLAKIINAISKKMKITVDHWVADPAIFNKILRTGEIDENKQDVQGESYAEVMMNAGLSLVSGDNNRLSGWGKFHELLANAPDGLPWFQVFDTCRNAIETIPALVFDETKFEDCDTEGPDHIADACRYFFMSRPSAPVTQPKEKRGIIAKAYEAAKRDYEQNEEFSDEYDGSGW